MSSDKDISTMEISNTEKQDSMQSVLLTNGLSLIAIAVTVWVGLNVYNNLKESEIEKKLHEQREAIDKALKDFKDWRKKFEEYSKKMVEINNRGYLLDILRELKQSVNKYEISSYLYDLFYSKKPSEFKTDLLKNLAETEQMFGLCYTEYENLNSLSCVKYAEKTLDIIFQIEKEQTNLEAENKELKADIQFYLDIRKSDCYFYIYTAESYSPYKSKEYALDSINLYQNCLKKLNSSVWENQSLLIGYMNNSMAYAVVLIWSALSEQEKNEYKEKAKKWFETALRYNPKGRYFQNYGSFLEKCGDIDGAYQQYKEATKAEKRDKKVYNLLGSCCLKIFDAKEELNKRCEKGFLLCEKKGTNCPEELWQYLQNAVTYLEFSINVHPNLKDGYMNLAKAYSYMYLYGDGNVEIYKNNALQQIKKAKLLDRQEGNKISNGILFTERNLYEALGDIERANAINETIRSGDWEKFQKIYKKKLKNA